ncbi:MAG: hypothetical protein IPM39_26495 [Chloroflexi bacterium]|nr:hypothetical protein [Chloroflexota bacterium]
MGKRAQVSRFIQHLGELTEKMPDKRAGRHNQIYALQDAVRGAFSIFFMQSASFLAHQRLMAQKRGRSNLESVFQMSRIPTDNHIRTLLDGVPASHFAGAYQWLWQQLVAEEKLAGFRALAAILNVENGYRENSGAMPMYQRGVALCANQIKVQCYVARFRVQ